MFQLHVLLHPNLSCLDKFLNASSNVTQGTPTDELHHSMGFGTLRTQQGRHELVEDAGGMVFVLRRTKYLPLCREELFGEVPRPGRKHN